MKTKKVLAAFLSAAMVLTSMAVPVFADGESAGSGGSAGGGTGGVVVSGVKIAEGKTYGTIQEAYNEIKAALEAKAGLVEQPLNEEAFNAFFTDGGKITWTISGEQKVTDSRMFSFGRGANRFGDGRHITEIDIVGDENAVLDLSDVNGTFALPYNWWNVADSANTTLKCKNITFDGIKSMPSGTYQCNLYPTVYEFDNCTFNGNLYSYQNFDVDMTIKNSTFNAPDDKTQYAFMSQGKGGTITLDNNKIIGYTRGINLQRETADFIVKNNTIKSTVSEPDHGAVQITDGKSFVVTGNTIDVNGGNAFLFHSAATNDKVTYTISDNYIKAPYLACDDTIFGVSDKITALGNIYNNTDTVNCMKKDAEEPSKSTVTALQGVAQIGDKYYSSLKAAIEAVSDAATEVKLLNNTTESITIPAGKNITLDLNGKNITSDKESAIINKGTLTVKGAGNVSASGGSYAAVANFPGATANLNGGTYSSYNWYVIKNLGAMIIDGDVTIKTDNKTNPSSLIDNGWVNTFDKVGGELVSAQADKASLTIKSGNFLGKSGEKSCSVVKNDDYGTLIIEGGTFDSTNNKGMSNAATILNWNIATISGGIFKGSYPLSNGAIEDNNSDQGKLTVTGGMFVGTDTIFGFPTQGSTGKGTVEISGGTFTALGSNFASDQALEKYTIKISGGTFSADVSKYLDKDKDLMLKQNSFGKYVVINKKNKETVQMGETKYPTIKEALVALDNAQENTATIKLLMNTTESITIPEGKNITLDLNGYTLTNDEDESIDQNNKLIKEGKHTIENKGTLTITDSSTAKTGKVDNVSNTKAALVNYEGATATLNGGTFDRSKEAGSKELNSETNKYDYKTGGNTYYTIRNYGAMTINEGVVANNKGVFTSLLSNGYYSPYKIVKDSENGKETKVPYFDGNKKADGTTAVTEPDPNRSLTINGGTFTGGKYIVKNDDYGKVIIKGGTFKKADQAPLLNWCDAEVTGGTFEKGSVGLAVYNGYSSKETGTGNLKISGGNFDGKILVADLTETEKAKTSISGGTFSEDVSKYCVDGYVASKNSDGTYSVLVQTKNRDNNKNTNRITPVYTNPTYTKDIFGVEHKSHVAYINGYADGTVKPDGNITREELAAILYRVSNDASAVVASGDKFNDVSADRWSANAIEFMANKKVVNGYEDGSFKPENNLTRGEFAAMIARFANLTDTAASRTFSDVDSSYWGFKNIMALNKAGYINGYEDGTFRPEANVTRAEVMTVINKIIGRSADASYVKSLDNNKFSDLDKNAWYYVDVMEATTDHNYTLNKNGVETEWSK